MNKAREKFIASVIIWEEEDKECCEMKKLETEVVVE